MKPIVNIYMENMVEAKMLAAMLYRYGDGLLLDVPDSTFWQARIKGIEVALPDKKYMIYRGGEN